jgi:microcystin-dependent protein
MEPYIGEIRMLGFGWDPEHWLPCDGRSLNIDEYPALYSLLGNTYGGDATTFNLPDMRGRAVMSQGNSRYSGQMGGYESIGLLQSQLPSHVHTIEGQEADAEEISPSGQSFGVTLQSDIYKSDVVPDAEMSSKVLQATGGGVYHYNMQPYCTINYVIAVEGLYPQRS